MQRLTEPVSTVLSDAGTIPVKIPYAQKRKVYPHFKKNLKDLQTGKIILKNNKKELFPNFKSFIQGYISQNKDNYVV